MSGVIQRDFRYVFPKTTNFREERPRLCWEHMYGLLAANKNTEIKAIAIECGFDNLEVFYRCFKRGTGTTPGEYRNRNQAY